LRFDFPTKIATANSCGGGNAIAGIKSKSTDPSSVAVAQKAADALLKKKLPFADQKTLPAKDSAALLLFDGPATAVAPLLSGSFFAIAAVSRIQHALPLPLAIHLAVAATEKIESRKRNSRI
jgi:hypothetical protein